MLSPCMSWDFKCNEENEKLLNILKEIFAQDISLAIPTASYPFHIHAGLFNIGTYISILRT